VVSAHIALHITKLLAAHGCWLSFLPTYLPDVLPIGLAVAKGKRVLHSIVARTAEALSQAIVRALA